MIRQPGPGKGQTVTYSTLDGPVMYSYVRGTCLGDHFREDSSGKRAPDSDGAPDRRGRPHRPHPARFRNRRPSGNASRDQSPDHRSLCGEARVRGVLGSARTRTRWFYSAASTAQPTDPPSTTFFSNSRHGRCFVLRDPSGGQWSVGRARQAHPQGETCMDPLRRNLTRRGVGSP